MWDEEDGFFYDVLRLPDGRSQRLKVRSLVGLLPLCAVTVFEGELIERIPEARAHLRKFLEARPELIAAIHDPTKPSREGRRLAAILNEARLRRVLEKMLDEREFFSPYGIRSLSRFHEDHPYTFRVHHEDYRVSYLAAESDSGMLILPRRPRRDRPIPDAQPARRSCAAPWSYAHAASKMHRLTTGGDESSPGELARIIHHG